MQTHFPSHIGSATALNALSCMLTTGGGYLPLPSRSMIESITLSCITSFRLKTRNKFAAWPTLKIAILKLGSACLCTPWPDGAMSSILDDLKVFAWTCFRDHDVEVMAGANDCSRLCDSLSMPRVPALTVVSRMDGLNGSRGAAFQQTPSTASLIEDLKSAREEISACEKNASLPIPSTSKDPIEKVEKKKKRQKDRAFDDADATKRPTETSGRTDDVQLYSATEAETQWDEESTANDTPHESSEGFAVHYPSEGSVAADIFVDGKTSPNKMNGNSIHRKVMPETANQHQADVKETFKPSSPLYHQPMEANDADTDDDDFLPDIVDCGPDEEDR